MVTFFVFHERASRQNESPPAKQLWLSCDMMTCLLPSFSIGNVDAKRCDAASVYQCRAFRVLYLPHPKYLNAGPSAVHSQHVQSLAECAKSRLL